MESVAPNSTPVLELVPALAEARSSDCAASAVAWIRTGTVNGQQPPNHDSHEAARSLRHIPHKIEAQPVFHVARPFRIGLGSGDPANPILRFRPKSDASPAWSHLVAEPDASPRDTVTSRTPASPPRNPSALSAPLAQDPGRRALGIGLARNPSRQNPRAEVVTTRACVAHITASRRHRWVRTNA